MVEELTQDTLLRELRRLNLYPPQAHQLEELRLKIEARINRSESPHDDLELARYGALLYGLAIRVLEGDVDEEGLSSSVFEETESVPFICIDMLARIGICGRTMAADLLCNPGLPLLLIRDWFAKIPTGTAISVADRILALSRKDAGDRVALAREVLENATAMERWDAVDFFQRNGTRKGQLTFSTLDNFMTGSYGAQCRKSLNAPETLEEISECADSMPPYPEKELVIDVAFHLRTMDPVIMRKVLRAVERLADEVDDRTLKKIVPLAMSPSIFLAKAAMDVIAKFGGTRRGRIFARVFNESTQTRAELINRLPLLSGDDFAQFMNNIPKGFHIPVISTLFSTVSDEDPECFGKIMASMIKGAQSRRKNNLARLVKDMLERDSLAEPPAPVMGEGRILQGDYFVRFGAPIVLNIMKKRAGAG